MLLTIAVITLTWGLASYILYSILISIITSYRHAVKSRDLGCEEPPFLKNKYPLGIDNVLQALAADKAQQFPVHMIERFEAEHVA